jgi:ketosteroid isomerase-like protein
MTLPAIVQRYLASYNAMDVASLVECVSDSVVFEHVSNAGSSIKIEGRAAFAGLADQAAALFVRRRQIVRTVLVDGDKVALEIVWTGMPTVDFGQMKAGVETTLRGASFFTIKEGKLAEIVDIS